MEPVRAGIAGLGWWGRKMTELVAAGGAGLRFVNATDPADGAEAFAARFGIPFSRDLPTLLADPRVEAVVLATPHTLHEAQIEACVAAGKHVFCEKPLALTRAGAVRAVELCRAGGVVLGMGHERRFEPPVARMIADADAGRFGRLLQIEANFSHDKFLSLDPLNWRLRSEHAPAAGMTATGIHLTDLAIRLMGPARDVRVVCERLASDIPQGDTLSAHIRFAHGGTAYVSASLAMPFVSRFAVFGMLGWVDIRDKAHVEAPAGWVVTSAWKGEPIQVAEIGPSEPVADNLRSFAAAIRGEAAYPIAGEEMIANIALLEAIVLGAATSKIHPIG
jgi:predicted dehydrogenase